MMQAEAFTVLNLIPEFRVSLLHDKEGIQISFVGICITLADIARVFFLGYPHADGIAGFGLLLEFVFERGLAGLEILELLFHFPVDLHVVGFQNPGVAQGVTIVKHFLEMIAAKASLIGLFPDIALHIGGAGA